MSTYLLIHGAWFGQWCWHAVKPLLEQAGHTVITLDLPGHGDDLTPVPEITMATLVARVGKELTAQTEPVILVGHSMGGMVISQTAEAYPDRIERLVYAAAYLLQDGQSLFQVSTADADSQIGPYLLPDPDKGLIGIRPEALNEIFLHDAPAAMLVEAEARLRPDLIGPQTTPVHLTAANYGRVPRTYITTLNDRVISPSLQKQMFTATSCDRVLEIETGHSPFAAKPEEFTQLLTALVE
ncbi:MAG: alpha/beta fold hydrolase [Leptolyngbya sp. BL-A-14]